MDDVQAPARHPDYAEARAHFGAKAATEAHTSDFVPTTKVAAFDGLTVARQHLAPRTMVPGRRHATAGPCRPYPRPGHPGPDRPGPDHPAGWPHRRPVTHGAGGNTI